MGHTGSASYGTFAAHGDTLVTGVTVGLQDALELREHVHRAVAVTTDGEVEHVQRHRCTAIDPHAPRHAAASFVGRRTEDLVDALRPRIIRLWLRDRLGQQQRHARVIGAHDVAGQHGLLEVLDQWADDDSTGTEDVQQRRAAPASSRCQRRDPADGTPAGGSRTSP